MNLGPSLPAHRLPQSVLSWGVPNPLSHAARSKFISRGPVHSALIAMEMDKSIWPRVFGGIDGGYEIYICSVFGSTQNSRTICHKY